MDFVSAPGDKNDKRELSLCPTVLPKESSHRYFLANRVRTAQGWTTSPRPAAADRNAGRRGARCISDQTFGLRTSGAVARCSFFSFQPAKVNFQNFASAKQSLFPKIVERARNRNKIYLHIQLTVFNIHLLHSLFVETIQCIV